MKIPFLRTKTETDLLLTLGWTPLWWLLGVNVLIYQIMVALVLLKFFTENYRSDGSISIPRPLLALIFFMAIYLISLLFNLGNHPEQRIIASLNNFFMFAMGFCIMLTLYNAGTPGFVRRLFQTGHRLTLITAGIALFFLLAWWGMKWTFQMQPLMAHMFPGLKNFPFFYVQWIIQGVTLDWKIGNIPRISVYSGVSIATGGFMAMILPLSIGFQHFKGGRKFLKAGIFIFSLVPFVFSLSRTAVCAFAAAWVLVMLVEKGLKPIWCFLYFFITFTVADKAYQALQWLFFMRPESTWGRLGIYEEAFSLVMEHNPWLGLGARPRDEFSTMIVGSHSHYVEMLLVTGVLGLTFFLIFQAMMLMEWFSQKKYLLTHEHRSLWKYIGISHLAADAVLLTSGLDSISLTAYTYFLIAGGILYHGREVRLFYASHKNREREVENAEAL